MSEWVIRIENLGKRYRVRHELDSHRYVALRDVIVERFNQLVRKSGVARPFSEDFWALKDVSFEVKQGEAVGIIGRNGAGKSTLLKILSRITEPTAGRIRLKGRVSSLLEVGTGFHPELTGRENIFLNGTILGMRKSEINRKFDAIVSFSGVEKFIDTPVKRFSSGMLVRLAFSVAAHLEPEVLVIDEVLAVGDAAFQKKCLGKMQDVASEGRTVLFVSHDLAAVEKLCTRAILMDSGKCQTDGPTSETINRYQTSMVQSAFRDLTSRKDRKGEGGVRFSRIQLLNDQGNEQNVFLSGKPLRIRMHYRSQGSDPHLNSRVSVSVHGWGKDYFLASTELHSDEPLTLPPNGFIDCVINELPLSLGTYYLTAFMEANSVIQDWIEAAATLQVEDGNFYGTGKDYPPGWDGKTVLVRHRWETAQEMVLATSQCSLSDAVRS
jgi:lipopolysaccharide transport system ATP-binding protein